MANAVFNALIICYLFLGGAGAGALVLLSLFELVEAKKRFGVTTRTTLRSVVADESFSRCWSVCVAVLGFGMLCLLVDLGRPDRIMNLLFSPTFSPITVGAYSLVGSLLCAGIFAVMELLDGVRPPLIFVRILAGAGILFGLVASAYTGVLLQGMASILFWNNPLLPLLFMASSLSTGVAWVFVGFAFVDGRIPPVRRIMNLARIDTAIIATEVVVLGLFVLFALVDTGARASLEALLLGEYCVIFWVGVVLCGMVIPFILEWFLTTRNYRMQMLWIAAFVLIGGLLLRVCIVGVGAYDATQSPDLLYGYSGAIAGLLSSF